MVNGARIDDLACETFLPEAEARALAAHLTADDDGWRYAAEKAPEGWTVVAYDEEGERLGAL